jgi:hypothetical protein
MLLNSSTLNSTALNGTARSGMINAEGFILSAFVVSAFISVTQPATASASFDTSVLADSVRVVLPIGEPVSVSTVTASEGGRVVLPIGYSNLAIESTATGDVTRYVNATADFDVVSDARISVERFVNAQAQTDFTYFADGKRTILAEGVADVLGIISSNGQRNAFAIARADFDLSAVNAGTITYTFPKVSAAIALTADARLTVIQPAYGDSDIALTTNNLRARNNSKAIGSSAIDLRPSAFARVDRFVKTAPTSLLGMTVAASASNTIYTNASAYFQFITSADGVVPAWADFDFTVTGIATKSHAGFGGFSALTTEVNGDGIVTRYVTAEATAALDTYGSGALKLITGGFLQDAYGNAELDFNAGTDDRLVLRFTGGFSLVEFNAQAIAGQTMAVKGAASSTVFSTTANYIVKRSTAAEARTLTTEASGYAVRVLKPEADALLFATANGYPTRVQKASAGANAAFAVSGFGKLAEKSSGEASIGFTYQADATQRQTAYPDGVVLDWVVVGTAGRIAQGQGTVTFELLRVDATALSNLTMPAPDTRRLTIEPLTRVIIVPEQIRTMEA